MNEITVKTTTLRRVYRSCDALEALYNEQPGLETRKTSVYARELTDDQMRDLPPMMTRMGF